MKCFIVPMHPLTTGCRLVNPSIRQEGTGRFPERTRLPGVLNLLCIMLSDAWTFVSKLMPGFGIEHLPRKHSHELTVLTGIGSVFWKTLSSRKQRLSKRKKTMNYSKLTSQPLLFLISFAVGLICSQSIRAQTYHEITPVADPEGFAAPYVGVSNGSLIIAGGANFPNEPRWETDKVWYDSIYILKSPEGRWKKSKSKLPRPLAYGLSFNLAETDKLLAEDVPHGVLCVGGGDSQQHVSDCFVLSLDRGRVTTTPLPALPTPLANGTGVYHQGVVYVLGGLAAPTAKRPADVFYKLDLTHAKSTRQWESLTTWPGNPRMLAIAGIIENSLFLFSGTDLIEDDAGTVNRKYLTDGFRFDLVSGKWSKTAALPRPAVAAPTPAITQGNSLLIVSGDHGKYAAQTDTLKDNHPGFPASVLAYNAAEDSWGEANPFPKAVGNDPAKDPHAGLWPPVVTNLTQWHGHTILACGEVRPRVRSRRVFMIKP